jgi:DNA-binding winged helix-turn-helix (wHTH) protein
MRTQTGPSRASSLLVEVAGRTATIDGIRIELPPMEFGLLALLAARPGEVVSHKELAAEAFGEGATMAPHDLHWRIWKLRELVGDKEREHKLIENRRGQGYVLNLPPGAVEILEGVSALPLEDGVVESIPEEASDPDTATAKSSKADVPETVIPQESPRGRVLRPKVVIATSLTGILALSGSWLAGYALSSRDATQPKSAPQVVEDGDASHRRSPKGKPKEPHRNKERGRKRAADQKGSDGTVAQVPAIAAPDSAGGMPATSPGGTGSSKGSDQSSPERSAPEPALAAAPTRYLYHLKHPETGDHFVTTDGNIVSTYEGRGYVGGAIGRIYTSAPEGVATKAISTNGGTAYIFSGSSNKTEPASSTLPLYYSTNNDGDFFYTTNAGEAKATGWNGVLIGYVRTLG